MTSRRRLVGKLRMAGLVGALLVVGGAAANGTMLKLSLPELVAGADAVVVGRVVGLESFWDGDESLIYTAVALAVEEQLKGAPVGSKASLLVLGGVVGGIGLAASDTPQFGLGEQAVVFLRALTPVQVAERRLSPTTAPLSPTFEVYGGFQGKLEVVEGRVRGVPLDELRLQVLRLQVEPGPLVEPALAEPEYITHPLYVLTGQRWPGQWPNVSYVVHTGFTDAQNRAIRSSTNTWNNAGARFTYTYAGTHSRAGGAQRNGANEVVWADLGEGPTLGRGQWWYSVPDSSILEIDVEFNTRHSWSTSTPPDANDFESVSLHEFGHCLGLGHTDVADAVMYYMLTIRTAKRALHADDIAGIRAIYGVPGTPPAGPVLAVTPASRTVGAAAGTTTFSVANTGGGTMNWTAAVTAGGGWLQITSGASGTDAGTITVSYAPNSGASSRTGTITVTAPGATGSPATVTVVQAGASPAENRPPTVSLRYSPANPTTADTIVFTATASDPDGDPLTYEWYLNGTRQTEVSPTASEVRWPNPRAGSHTLRVVVSDGRGGTGEASVTFTVSAPGTPPGDGSSHTYGNVQGWYLVSLPVPSGEPLPGITMWWWNPGRRAYERPSSLSPVRGYWARLPAGTRVTISTTPPTADQALELGAAGWHMVSAPWPYPRDAIQVVRGGETRGWAEAVAAGWVRNAVYGYKATDGAYTSPTTLSPWYGYWLEAKVSGLSLRFRYAARATAASLLTDEPDSLLLWQSPTELPPPPPADRGAVSDVQFGNSPNPITDVRTTTFRVTGPMASLVTEIKVTVFDLSGKLVWQGSAAGAELSWHTDDLAGRYLANGVYLYQITAEVAGTTVSSPLLKLAIYR